MRLCTICLIYIFNIDGSQPHNTRPGSLVCTQFLETFRFRTLNIDITIITSNQLIIFELFKNNFGTRYINPVLIK